MAEDLVPTGPLPERVVGGLAELRAALLRLDDERQRLAEAGDYESLSWGVQDLQVLVKDLRQLTDDARRDIAKVVDERQGNLSSDGTYYYGVNRIEVPGLGAVEVNGGWTRTKWRSVELLGRLVRDIAESSDERIVTADGEIVAPADSVLLATVVEVLSETMPLNPSLSWRVGKTDGTTGLRKHGIDSDNWCEKVPKTRLATVPSAE
jgi:hypothetical protein